MAAIQALTAQAINVATTSPHATFREVCKIDASNFTAGAKYLILASAFARQNSSANETILRLNHGTTLFTDGSLAYEQTANTQIANYSWMYVWTQPGTAEDVVMEMASSATQVVTVEWAGIVAINLDDVGTQGTEYFYNEVTTDLSVDSASVFDGASVSFTGSGDDYWLIVGQAAVSGVATNSNHKMFLNDSFEGDIVDIDIEGEDATNEIRGYMLMSVLDQPSGARTVKTTFQRESATFTVLSSRVFAINLSAFAQHAYQYEFSNESIATSPTWSTLASVAPNPALTGNWLIWGYHSLDVGSDSDAASTRLQINPDGSGLVSDPAYADNAPGLLAWDATDIIPVNLFRLRQLTSGGSRVINYETTLTSGSSATMQRRTLVAIAMEQPSSGPVEHFSGPIEVSADSDVSFLIREEHESGQLSVNSTGLILVSDVPNIVVRVKPGGTVGVDCEFTSLEAAFSDYSSYDLTANATRITFVCYAGAGGAVDSTPAQSSTHFVNATENYFITIMAAEDHGGVWNTNCYIMSVTDANALRSAIDYTRIIGLQVEVTDLTSNAVCIENIGGSPTYINRCIVRSDTTDWGYGIHCGGTNDTIVSNSLVYNIRRGISTGTGEQTAHHKIYNCTVVDTYLGIENRFDAGSTGSMTVTNTIVAASNNDFAVGDLGIIQSYNTSIDTTASGTGSQTNVVPTFVNAAGGDYRLASTDTIAIDNGTNLSAVIQPEFNRDISGDLRTGTWDIGADEYVASGPTEHFSGNIVASGTGAVAATGLQTIGSGGVTNAASGAITVSGLATSSTAVAAAATSIVIIGDTEATVVGQVQSSATSAIATAPQQVSTAEGLLSSSAAVTVASEAVTVGQVDGTASASVSVATTPVIHYASATVASTSDMSVVDQSIQSSSTELAGTSALAATGYQTVSASLSLSANASGSASPIGVSITGLAASATSEIVIDSAHQAISAALLASASSVSAAAEQTAYSELVSLDAASDAAVDGEVIGFNEVLSGSISVSATTAIASASETVALATATTTADSSMSASGAQTSFSAIDVSAESDLLASAVRQQLSGALVLSATTSLAAVAYQTSSSTLSGDSTGLISSDAYQLSESGNAIAGSALATVSAYQQLTSAVDLSADGSITIVSSDAFTPINEVFSGTLVLSGSELVEVSPLQIGYGVSSLELAEDISADGYQSVTSSFDLDALASATAVGVRWVLSGEVLLSALDDVSLDSQVVGVGTSSLTADGLVTVNGSQFVIGETLLAGVGALIVTSYSGQFAADELMESLQNSIYFLRVMEPASLVVLAPDELRVPGVPIIKVMRGRL